MNAADLTSGSVVDRYTISRVLGEGGMAIVYQVEHNQLGSQHALKVLTLASKQIRERLLLEGRAQATLRHPNVVTVTDVVDIGGSPGLIMEYIEGPSLDDYLESQSLTVEQVDALARGILAGVAAAHDAGLVHRDLKPANIMLSIATGGLQPKVTDFGLAKIVAQGENSKTRTGSTMGTPHYMSPEQIDDSKNVGPGTDIWALGAIFYEMLCGERAFPGDNLLAIFSAVNKGDYIPIGERVSGVPERMQAAIHAALERDIDKRPASVQELFSMWTGGEESMTVSAPAMGPWDASALSQARSMAQGPPQHTIEELPKSGGTLADTRNSSSTLSSSATLIGLGGTVVGVTAVVGVLVLALVIAGGAVWYAVNLEPEVITKIEKEEVLVPVPGEPAPAAADADPADPKPTGTQPRRSSRPKPSPGTPPPTADTEEEEEEPEAATEEPEGVTEEPEPETPEPEPAPEPVAEPEPSTVDTGAAVAEADVEAPAVDTGSGVTLGLLESPDPDIRLNSVRRKLGSPNEDTSRALYELFQKEQVSKVKKAALDGLISLWDEDKGHWSTNNEAMVYAMTQGSTYALPAAQAYGRNGQDPNGLLGALKHSDPKVREEGVEAAGQVIPRAPSGFDGRGFIEPYTSDADSSVAKAAQKVMKSL